MSILEFEKEKVRHEEIRKGGGRGGREGRREVGAGVEERLKEFEALGSRGGGKMKVREEGGGGGGGGGESGEGGEVEGGIVGEGDWEGGRGERKKGRGRGRRRKSLWDQIPKLIPLPPSLLSSPPFPNILKF